jgi:hypothetical protein
MGNVWTDSNTWVTGRSDASGANGATPKAVTWFNSKIMKRDFRMVAKAVRSSRVNEGCQDKAQVPIKAAPDRRREGTETVATGVIWAAEAGTDSCRRTCKAVGQTRGSPATNNIIKMGPLHAVSDANISIKTSRYSKKPYESRP